MYIYLPYYVHTSLFSNQAKFQPPILGSAPECGAQAHLSQLPSCDNHSPGLPPRVKPVSMLLCYFLSSINTEILYPPTWQPWLLKLEVSGAPLTLPC